MLNPVRGLLRRPLGVAAVARPLALIAVLSAATGCTGFFQSQTGDVMSDYTVSHMVPYMMGHGDLASACEAGVSMGSFLMSFERVTDAPHRPALLTLQSAGMCADEVAWEANLRGLRALRDGNAAEARDAHTAEQRAHIWAARTYYASYQRLEAYFGVPGDGCPEYEEDENPFYYLLGLSAGMLALVHDRAVEGIVGVPMDLPQKVGRAAACLDNETWWGVPSALQASVWASVPGAGPEDADPLAMLEAAAEVGEANGVRLARAFQVQLLETSGRADALRQAIADHAASLAVVTSNPDWQLLDVYATRMVEAASDRIWTAERGYRTPLGELGTFYTEPTAPAGSDEMFDDLFEGLDDGSAAPAPEETPSDTEENPE